MAKKSATIAKKAPKKAAEKAIKAKPAVKKAADSKKIVVTSDQLREMVEKRAYEMFLERGCSHGGNEGDWYLAEKELRSKVKIKGN